MDTETKYTLSAQISLRGGAAPEQIEILPLGEFDLVDGRGTLRLEPEAAQAVIARSLAQAPGGVMPIDYDHALDEGGTGDGRAAGWITGLRVEGDRIMASVDWTEDGRRNVEAKNWRFVSPVFFTAKGSQDVVRIARAALTNNPALPQLKQLASQQPTTEADMDPHLKAIADALGLSDANGDKIVASVQTLINSGTAIVSAAGLTGALDAANSGEVITKITAAQKAAPDPAKYVPIEIANDLQKQLAAAQTKGAEGDVERIVASALEEGKLIPAQKAWAEAYAKSDMGGFKTWLASTVALFQPGADRDEIVVAPKAQDGLTDHEKQICAATGVSEEAFLATRKAQEA